MLANVVKVSPTIILWMKPLEVSKEGQLCDITFTREVEIKTTTIKWENNNILEKVGEKRKRREEKLGEEEEEEGWLKCEAKAMSRKESASSLHSSFCGSLCDRMTA
jgi:hypothetical protein